MHKKLAAMFWCFVLFQNFFGFVLMSNNKNPFVVCVCVCRLFPTKFILVRAQVLRTSTPKWRSSSKRTRRSWPRTSGSAPSAARNSRWEEMLCVGCWSAVGRRIRRPFHYFIKKPLARTPLPQACDRSNFVAISSVGEVGHHLHPPVIAELLAFSCIRLADSQQLGLQRRSILWKK